MKHIPINRTPHHASSSNFVPRRRRATLDSYLSTMPAEVYILTNIDIQDTQDGERLALRVSKSLIVHSMHGFCTFDARTSVYETHPR